MNSIDRRSFLKITAGAAAGAAFAATPVFAQTKKRAIKKGVNLGMVQTKGSVADKFKLLKDLGFDGIELNRPGGAAADEILKARDASGLAVGNIIDSVHWGKSLSDPNPEVRAQGVEGLKSALHDARDFGCPTVLLVPAVVKKDVSYADAYTRSQAEIRKVIPLAEELKVKIDIENVWNQFLLSPLEAARFVDELGSPWVGWHFDVGNVINYGWPEQWVRILGKRIGCLHIKEFSRSKRDKEGLWKGFGVELMEGDDDWPAVMKALDEVGYSGWAIAEIPGGDEARLKDIAARMDKIFAS
jgi:hexulose-6-phosphate isomerase